MVKGFGGEAREEARLARVMLKWKGRTRRTWTRGTYAGAVGYFSFNGNLDTCITIRTIVCKDGRCHVQAGAGVVADSNAESEFEETQRKAAGMFRAIEVSAQQENW